MSGVRVIWLLGINLFVGCRAEAPEDYDALISYMVEHYHDDPAYLEDGVDQLFTLLGDDVAKNLGRGQRIQTLTAEAVQTLEPDLEYQPELLGIVRSRDFPYTVEDLAYTNFLVHPRDVFTNPDAVNERTYLSEPECFVDGECEDLEYEATLQRFLPLGIDATIYFHTHIRWVESDWGPVFIQQRWLTDTPEISVNWIHLNHGYSFAVTIPWADEDDTVYAKQIEHIWGDIALGDMPIPEEGAFMVASDVLGGILRQFEEYLDANPLR